MMVSFPWWSKKSVSDESLFDEADQQFRLHLQEKIIFNVKSRTVVYWAAIKEWISQAYRLIYRLSRRKTNKIWTSPWRMMYVSTARDLSAASICSSSSIWSLPVLSVMPKVFVRFAKSWAKKARTSKLLPRSKIIKAYRSTLWSIFRWALANWRCPPLFLCFQLWRHSRRSWWNHGGSGWYGYRDSSTKGLRRPENDDCQV